MKQTIEFKDISGWLKTAIIISWSLGIMFAIAFIVGFIQEMLQ